MIKWLCQIRTKEENDMISQNIVLLRIFTIGASYCKLRGNHVEVTLGVGPISGSFGISVWNHLLP